uniref:Uncharacterized protein n=2 Tax=Arundo donax TaxID=35708 RepID=A0A0A8XU74_ARUDO
MPGSVKRAAAPTSQVSSGAVAVDPLAAISQSEWLGAWVQEVLLGDELRRCFCIIVAFRLSVLVGCLVPEKQFVQQRRARFPYRKVRIKR